jgi:hypothetical protein
MFGKLRCLFEGKAFTLKTNYVKGYPFQTPEIDIARDGVFGCSSKHTQLLHLILFDMQTTRKWVSVASIRCWFMLVGVFRQQLLFIPVLSVLAMYITGALHKPSSLSCGATLNS